ncbi:MAG: metallophosphoesterase [Chitinophagales bacterium]|nr:metallophosphoesterase [Chitinophagales bacterium]
MRYFFLLLALYQTYAATALPSDSSTVLPKPFTENLIPKNALVFYVIGDWGRKGKYHQRKVAEAMNTCAEVAPPQFIISTGDNFYTFGVKSTNDKLWKKSYENIYNGNAIKETDWYPVLGNHDHYGNQQAEIDYSKINPHWKMPSDYFAMETKTADNTQVTFVFTNTEPLVHSNNTATNNQWKFIDSTLSASNSAWKLVVGHHPVYSSNPMHGDSPPLIEKLKPILEKYNVQAYFCGHDHDLQHQQPKGSKVDYFVSGAGSELRPSASYQHTLFAKSIAGFAMVAITNHTMYVYFIDENGNVIYQYSRGK